jgi:hypothetical protein
MPVHVLDIAAGHGRYVLEALGWGIRAKPDSHPPAGLFADQRGQGRRADRRARPQDVPASRRADAFDHGEGLAALTPKPTLAIVSGLYELFPDNAPIEASLAGAGPGDGAGGAARLYRPALASAARDDRPGADRAIAAARRGSCGGALSRRWISSSRATAFRKLEQRIDTWGIFTVSLAERI